MGLLSRERAALVVVDVQEGFRNLFQQSSLLIYGILIVIMVRFAPDGLSGRLKLVFRRIASWR